MRNTATVAVLFCDVVGSTERLTRLGDEAGDEFRRRVFAELRRCVVESRGTEVKNLGDGLMVVFEHSTIDAIECAARMHTAAAGIDRVDPVHLRVGISVGEVAHEDADWFGTPVVEAARLCSAAATDQTLAPALVVSVVGSRGRAHRFRPVGALALKGLAAPLPSVEVDGAESVEGDDDAPAGLPGTVDGPATVVPASRRRRWVVPIVAAVAVLVVTGAVLARPRGEDTGGDEMERATATPASDEVTRPDGYEPEFDTTECPADVTAAVPEATCGELEVPEYRGAPEGRSLRLAVVKVPAPDSAPAADPVVVLDVNEPAALTSLRGATDVYSLGLRGFTTDGDVPLTCPELQAVWSDTLQLRADDPEAIERRVEASDTCAARLRAAGVQLEGYNMAEAANDIRDLVDVLDLGQVSVAAGGYTTTAATAFARSNPGAVSSLLLTNPTPPGDSPLEDPAGALARSFEEVGELCRSDADCNEAYPDLEARFEQRYEELQARPRRVATRSLSGTGPHDVLLDGRRLAAAVESAMRESARLGLVPSAVQTASDELTAAAGIDEDINFFVSEQAPTAAFLSITCSYDAPLNRTAEISDAARRQFAGANEATFAPMCDSWGVPSVYDRVSQPLDSQVPALLAVGDLSVSGVNDWAGSMAAMLPNATVVRVPSMSEDLAFSPPPCLRELRREFVVDPAARHDGAACERDVAPIEFVGPS